MLFLGRRSSTACSAYAGTAVSPIYLTIIYEIIPPLHKVGKNANIIVFSFSHVENRSIKVPNTMVRAGYSGAPVTPVMPAFG